MIKKAQGTALGLVCALGVMASAGAAMAMGDPLIEGARLCTQRFPLEEKANNIPTHLLAAIATTESGRWHDGLGMSVPWPWTINVEGKGYYFNSKAEAIAQTRALLAKGRESIDVGCMQVNLKHHPKAFGDLEQAFDPVMNVAYAAQFLHDNYATLGDWIKATAAYHSRTPVHGQRYLGNIERSWNKIVAKVAAARAGKGGEVATVRKEMTSVAKSSLSVNNRPMPPARQMRVIKVNDSAPRRSSAMVMVRNAHAEPDAEPVVKVADAAAPPPVAKESAPVGNSVRRVSLDKPAEAGVAKPADTKFVFTN